MRHLIEVRTPRSYDPETVAAVLGESPLPDVSADGVRAPYLTVDGRIHGPTSDFLRTSMAEEPDHIEAMRTARVMASWLDFLCDDTDSWPAEDRLDVTLVATEEQFARFLTEHLARSTPAVHLAEERDRAVAAILTFHEYAQHVYRLPSLFDPRSVAARIVPVERFADDGVPLTPAFTDLLLRGARRVGVDGRSLPSPVAERDHALLSLGFATGLPPSGLSVITAHEIPSISRIPVSTMRAVSPAASGERPGAALVLTNRLRPVHAYMNGARRGLRERNGFMPSAPLDIVEANRSTVTLLERATGQVDSRAWDELSAVDRRRLVDLDGASAVLFLDHRQGVPLAEDELHQVVVDAIEFVRERLEPRFPVGLGFGDIRRTYAVHLAVVMLHFLVADASPDSDGSFAPAPRTGSDWTDGQIESAVRMVRNSLGVRSGSADELSVATVRRFLDISIEEFLGGGES